MTMSRELRAAERRRRTLAELRERNLAAEQAEKETEEALRARSGMPVNELNETVRRESIRRRTAHAERQPQAKDGTVPGTSYRTPGSPSLERKMEPVEEIENKMQVEPVPESKLNRMSREDLLGLAEEMEIEVTRRDGKPKPPTKNDIVAAIVKAQA